MCARLALWVALIRSFDNSELGHYGLIAATSQLAIVFFGFEYYLFTTREVATSPPPLRASLIREQAILHALAYIIAAPVLLTIAATGQITWTLAAWLAALLPAEHFSHELYRLLVALSHPTAANIVLFVRTGSWALVVTAAVFLARVPVQLNELLALWLIAALLSIAVGVAVVLPEARGPAERLSVERVTRGIRTALPFTFSAFAVMGANHAARYVLIATRGAAETGIYSFYMSMALTVEAMIQATTVNHVLPSMIRAADTRNTFAWNVALRRLIMGTTTAAVTLGIALAAAVPLALTALDRIDLLSDIAAFRIMLFGVAVSTLSQVWHYVLYAHHRDRWILLVNVGWLVTAAAGYFAFVPRFGVRGAAATYAVTACLAAVARFILARHSGLARVIEARTDITPTTAD